jgi:hypothetical protein
MGQQLRGLRRGQFDDDDPAMNEALLSALKTQRAAIEADFGTSLDWRGPESGGLMTKRTKVVAAKVSVGDRASPTTDGLSALADSARRLLQAVRPHLNGANDAATAALIELESDADAQVGDSDEHGLDPAVLKSEADPA